MSSSTVARFGLLALLAATGSWAEPKEAWRVLILQASEPFNPGTMIVNETLRAALIAAAPRPVAFQMEFLDSVSFDTSRFERELMALYRKKYEGVSMDLVVAIGPDARLGEVGDGMKVAMSALDTGRMSLAAGSVGIAQGCLEASIRYARERIQFGVPIARKQLVQELIADTAVEVDAARLMTWRVAGMADRGERHRLESSMAKYFASEVAVPDPHRHRPERLGMEDAGKPPHLRQRRRGRHRAGEHERHVGAAGAEELGVHEVLHGVAREATEDQDRDPERRSFRRRLLVASI